MKKFLSLTVLVLVLVSCGGTSKVAKQARKTFDGNWTLTSVTYPQNTGTFNVTLFNDAAASCLEGSTWDFVSNNNRGTYDVSGSNCTSGTRHFIWSIDEENTPQGVYDFLLKPVNEKYKSTNGNQGFRLNLSSLTQNSMVWEQTVTLEGSPFVIRMTFSKL
ncbi:lipocalin family protein [Zunongwangia sp.]|uniref:lipocalin family protein n=1 Tax=Zunongwangia sp. TaxID=1965325 RepID=UPI003AA96E28